MILLNIFALLGEDINTKILRKEDIYMKSKLGLGFLAIGGMVMIGVAAAMLLNTKAARRRRMIRRAVKTVHNVGCAMQKLSAF